MIPSDPLSRSVLAEALPAHLAQMFDTLTEPQEKILLATSRDHDGNLATVVVGIRRCLVIIEHPRADGQDEEVTFLPWDKVTTIRVVQGDTLVIHGPDQMRVLVQSATGEALSFAALLSDYLPR